jgi:hypothetical protein
MRSAYSGPEVTLSEDIVPSRRLSRHNRTLAMRAAARTGHASGGPAQPVLEGRPCALQAIGPQGSGGRRCATLGPRLRSRDTRQHGARWSHCSLSRSGTRKRRPRSGARRRPAALDRRNGACAPTAVLRRQSRQVFAFVCQTADAAWPPGASARLSMVGSSATGWHHDPGPGSVALGGTG